MDEDINKLILQLRSQLNKKYGRHFKNFYLTQGAENSDWQGLISSVDEVGGRNAEYYSINENTIVKDNKTIY